MRTGLSIAAMLLLIAGIAGSLWYRQHEKERAAQRQSAALQSQVQTLQSELAQGHARAEDRPVSVPAQSLRPAESSPAPAPATTTPAAGKAPNPAMLNDPETRALMRKQQEQGIAKMADKLVSKDFVRDWNLTPEQTKQVKDLVREKASAGKDLLTAMMFDGLDDQALAERGRETKRRFEQSDAALQGLLGENGFKALTEQEHVLEDRERVRRIREELASAEQPLTKPQEESLLETLAAERQGFSFRVDFSDPAKVDFEHVRDYFSEQNLQIYFEDLQQLSGRIAERAALFLSDAQVQQLKTAQNNSLEQARLTVKMTTELLNKRRAN